VRLEAALLRAALPDLVLREGSVLAARVAERSGRHGLLMLAGTALVAELPDDVRAGERLRLAVQDTAGDQVVLRVVPDPPTSVPPGVMALPLPDGRSAQVRVEEREAGGERGDADEPTVVTLVYDSPALGAIELRLAVDPTGASAHVQVGAGAPFLLAEEGREALRGALEGATGRSAAVEVLARRDPLDVYA
jgi:hypothetical protein